MIGKFWSLVHQKCLSTLYYSFIYPYLICCNIICGATYPTHFLKLFSLQKQCRIATFSRWTDPSAPLFKQLKILSIFNINKHQTCVFIFKMLHKPPSLPSLVIHFSSSTQMYIIMIQDKLNVYTSQCSILHSDISLLDIKGHSCGKVISKLHTSLLLLRTTNIGSVPVL